MPSTLVVTHERRGLWARALRPRLVGPGSIRWAESRSGADLARWLRGRSSPIVVVGLADRPEAALIELAPTIEAAPGALVLVLDPTGDPELADLAREAGATRVVSGVATPPEVAAIVAAWLPLAVARSAAAGWERDPDPEPAPWSPASLARMARTPTQA